MTTSHMEDKVYEVTCQNNELKVQVEQLTKEIKALQHIQRIKTSTIEKLSDEVERLSNLEEHCKELEKNLLAKEKEFNLTKLELQVAKRANDKMDRELFKLVNSKDESALRSLEGEKRFLQNEVKKKSELLAIKERSISFQSSKIESLEGRLSALNQALKETKLDKIVKPIPASQVLTSPRSETPDQSGNEDDREVEQIPVTLFNLLQADVEALRKMLQERELIVNDKDFLIEVLEKKCEVYEKACKQKKRPSSSAK